MAAIRSFLHRHGCRVMSNERIVTTVRLPPHIYDALARIAVRERRSVNSVMTFLLERAILTPINHREIPK